jgi:hypothetical protein
MKYDDFLSISDNNLFVKLLSFEGEWLEFEVNNQEDIDNIVNLQYNKVNFKHFKDNKFFKEYKKVNCLTYLLDFWHEYEVTSSQRFKIYYDGNHCWSDKYDLGNCKRSENYDLIENFHDKETVKRIFNLDDKYSTILDEYYTFISSVEKVS